MNIEIFTDGACEPNPGKGGWAFVVTENKEVTHSENGFIADTTNNAMELTAIKKALIWIGDNITSNATILIYSDSQYSVNSLTRWAHGWRANGWRIKSGKPAKNREVLEFSLDLLENLPFIIELKWVKGHNGNKFNELADELALRACRDQRSVPERQNNNVTPAMEFNFERYMYNLRHLRG